MAPASSGAAGRRRGLAVARCRRPRGPRPAPGAGPHRRTPRRSPAPRRHAAPTRRPRGRHRGRHPSRGIADPAPRRDRPRRPPRRQRSGRATAPSAGLPLPGGAVVLAPRRTGDGRVDRCRVDRRAGLEPLARPAAPRVRSGGRFGNRATPGARRVPAVGASSRPACCGRRPTCPPDATTPGRPPAGARERDRNAVAEPPRPRAATCRRRIAGSRPGRRRRAGGPSARGRSGP